MTVTNERLTDGFVTSLVGAITSTTRPVAFTVASTSADLAGGTFSLEIYDAGTEANPTHLEILECTSGGDTTTWTATNEPGHSPTTHAAGSTVKASVLTKRSLYQLRSDHSDAADPHTQYIKKFTFSAKGDLLAGTGSGTFTRQASGADGTVPIADSTQSSGWRMGVPSLSGVLTHMGDLIVGGVLGLTQRLGIGSPGTIAQAVQNSVAVADPGVAPTLSAGPGGGSLTNGAQYDFAYAWSNGSSPDGGTTLVSPLATFTATATGSVNVQAPAAPSAGLTLLVYAAAHSGQLYQSTTTLTNASTSTPNTVAISTLPANTRPIPNTTNTTGGVSVAWQGLSASQVPALDASKITTGTVATARLGSGTADSTTYLRGDQTYATPTGGGAGGTPTELQVTVYNGTGGTLLKGTPVSINGGISGAPAVYKSLGTDGAHVLGLVTADIANGATGTVQRQGVVSNLNTSGLTANFPAYVDNSGSLAALPGTNQKWVGYTLTVHATTGSIFVAPDDVITFRHGHYDNNSGGALSYPIVADVIQWGTSTDPGAAPSGYEYVWFDTADGLAKKTDASGVTAAIGGGGSGPSDSYVGYNTIGASNEQPVAYRQFMKKITPASTGMLLAVGAYMQLGTAGGATPNVSVGVLDDNSGVPGKVLASSFMNGTYQNTTARWFHMPCVYRLTGGVSYWLAVQVSGTTTGELIYYDTGGSDQVMTTGSFSTIADGSQYTLADSTKKYSIRGDYLS